MGKGPYVAHRAKMSRTKECPNCGGVAKKTGNATPGNTPEYKCEDCRWLNWHGRPAHTEPPYDDENGAETDGGTPVDEHTPSAAWLEQVAAENAPDRSHAGRRPVSSHGRSRRHRRRGR